MEYLVYYLLIINALAFLLMYVDKRKAQKNLWRIPERVLLGTALIGGSLGAMAGMQIFRHKTQHLKFVIGIPTMLTGHILLLIWLFCR
jgi:uncharacterized membrane protein YsdA (DUF1294 family)